MLYILLPAYNEEKNIIKIFKKIKKIKKKISPFKIILIDDCSKDNTKKLVKGYKNKNIKFFRIKNYGVIAKSRNFGIMKSKGKLFKIIFDKSKKIYSI